MAERRYNALTGDWVIVSPERVNRPWQGARDSHTETGQTWSEDCYLCPRNTRSSGIVNADYLGPFVFDNDFPALAGDASPVSDDALLRREIVDGRCRVLCYSDRHDLSLATLNATTLAGVIDVWRAQSIELSQDHAWVQIFENKGQMMGCSSEHPHGQIWATSTMPSIPLREDTHQAQYELAHGARLLLDYARREIGTGDRVVYRNSSWLAVVPFWAAWPFEILVMPTQPCGSFEEVSPSSAADLADLLRRVLSAYDALFGVSFPYSMGWHGRGRGLRDHWQLHAHFYPPLLRSATVRKFMVGFEMLAEAQRDLTPESAAARLRALIS